MLDGRHILRHIGVEAAELESRELLAYAAGKDRQTLLRDLRLYVGEDVEQRFAELLQRRMEGEPAAYIIGEWSFYDLDLDVNRSVLIPRTDTELIATRAIEVATLAGDGCRVLDLCTGSGCIGLAVAKHVHLCPGGAGRPQSRMPSDVARANARRNGLTSRVMCLQADAMQAPPSMLGLFDVHRLQSALYSFRGDSGP